MATEYLQENYYRLQNFNDRLIEKYGPQFGITPELVDKIFADPTTGETPATPEELERYEKGSADFVAKFKEDLRTKMPDDYDESDLRCLMAMVDANHVHIEDPDNNDPMVKILTGSGVGRVLTATEYVPEKDANGNDVIGKDGKPKMVKNPFYPPKLDGFNGLGKITEGLSPQQIQSQLGLDYEAWGDTPYLAKNDNGEYIRQPFCFAVKSPKTQEMIDAAKIPMDPRQLAKLLALMDSSTSSPEAKEEAMAFLDKYANKIILTPVKKPVPGYEKAVNDALAKVKAKYPDIEHQDSKDAPYTGTSAPIYGDRLSKESSFADVTQEMSLPNVNPKIDKQRAPAIAVGAVMTMRLPRKGGIDPEHGQLPAGCEEVVIAKWDGKKWNLLISDAEFEKRYKEALAFVEGDKRLGKEQKQKFRNDLKAFHTSVKKTRKKHQQDAFDNWIRKRSLAAEKVIFNDKHRKMTTKQKIDFTKPRENKASKLRKKHIAERIKH